MQTSILTQKSTRLLQNKPERNLLLHERIDINEGEGLFRENLLARKKQAKGWDDAFSQIQTSTNAARLAYRTYMAIQMLSDSVDIDRERRHGIPVLKGTRFKVSQLLAQIAEGDSIQDLADELELDRETVVEFLKALSIILDRPHVQ